VSKRRLYKFYSTWNITAPKDKVWHALAATPFSWQDWWPELIALHTLHAAPHLINTRFSCTWRARAGYRLQATFTVIAVSELQRVTFRSEGDLIGTAVWNYQALDAGHTEITIDWQVYTSKPWMNWFGPLLGPIFTGNHHALMLSAEHGLNDYLTRRA